MPKVHDRVRKILDDENAEELTKAELIEKCVCLASQNAELVETRDCMSKKNDYMAKQIAKLTASIGALEQRYGNRLDDYCDVENSPHSVCKNCEEAFSNGAFVSCSGVHCNPKTQYCFGCFEHDTKIDIVDGARVYLCDKCDE